MFKNYKNIQHLFFIIFLLGCSLLFFSIISGFIFAIFWAVVFSISFYNLYLIIKKKCNEKENFAASLTVGLIFFMVLIPLSVMAYALISESIEMYDLLKEGDIKISQPIDIIKEKIPYMDSLLHTLGTSSEELKKNIQSVVQHLTKTIANQSLTFTQNLFSSIVQFFLMLYLLFFFFRDGKKIIKKIIQVVPLGNKKEELLLTKFSEAIKATLKGTFLVALAQGFLGGTLFFMLGIQAPVLWGGMMAILSLLPIGGAAIVWAPVAIYLMIHGSVTKAIIIIVVGSLGIGLLDNILRPILVGKDTKMPDYLILITTFGGIEWFGLTGFIVGPVIAALFVVIWQIAGEEYGGNKS